MTPYGLSLALGVTGLVAMALRGGGHGHGGLGHAAHGHGGHAHAGHAGGRLMSLLSPRVLFSFLVGAGATGLLLAPFLLEPLVAAGAVVGGYVFERFLVGPIWNFMFRFESRPAATLESAIMEEASAETDFDPQGQGLIRLELDGQVVQLLGTLRAEDRAGVRRIRRGDRLRIEDVDPARNRCTVSFAGEGPTEGE